MRSFAQGHQDFNHIHERSNDRYDALIDLLQLHKHLRSFLPHSKPKNSALKDKNNENEIVGECLFRQLAYFDVGRSFTVDSLHNIYIGAFVSGETLSDRHALCITHFSEANGRALAERRISALGLECLGTS